MDKPAAGKVPASALINMSDREFSLFSTLIYTRLGIKMPVTKKQMLISRLNKRIRNLGLQSYGEYYNLINDEKASSDEFSRMIDVVTTNKTEFFREPEHFRFLVKRVLPELTAFCGNPDGTVITAWSAGCSTGQEPYTMAMIFTEFFSGKTGRFSIVATDVSRRVLQAGCNAVYTGDVVESIPETLRKKYLMKGTGEKSGLFKIVPELRERVSFRELNFMDDKYPVGRGFNIIFCRNVIIYFDRETQKKLFHKFYNHLVPGGYLFIGSSETLHGINDRFISTGPTVYKKPVVT